MKRLLFLFVANISAMDNSSKLDAICKRATKVKCLLVPLGRNTDSTKKQDALVNIKKFQEQPNIPQAEWSALFYWIALALKAADKIKKHNKDAEEVSIECIKALRLCGKNRTFFIHDSTARHAVSNFNAGCPDITIEASKIIIDLTNHVDFEIARLSRDSLYYLFMDFKLGSLPKIDRLVRSLCNMDIVDERNFALHMSRVGISSCISDLLNESKSTEADKIKSEIISSKQLQMASWSDKAKSGFIDEELAIALEKFSNFGQDIYKKQYFSRTSVMLVRGLADWDRAS